MTLASATAVSGALTVAALLAGPAAPAAASTCYTPGANCPTAVVKAPAAPVAVSAPSAPAGSSLPFTGADVAGLGIIGSGAIVVGVAMTRARRRHQDD